MFWLSLIVCTILTILFLHLLKHLNKDYYLWSLCRRIKTVDGSDLSTKVYIMPGSNAFGNNFDVMNLNSAGIFKIARSWNKRAQGKCFVLHFLFTAMLNINTAEDAEEILQSQKLITKNVIYDLLKPFLGDGLLISTGE